MSSQVIAKYLARYAEPAATEAKLWVSTSSLTKPYEGICVIPIFDESLENLMPFINFNSARCIAYVWVFNCPDNAFDEARLRTQKTLARLYECYSFSEGAGVAYANLNERTALYVFDYTSAESALAHKQGVGLARKIGLDFALYVSEDISARYGKQVNWLHSCDADVSLPQGYFDIPPPVEGQSVSLYPFIHRPEPGYETAMALYEFRLYYFVERLRWAGSPFAFHSIGSAIAVTPLAYAQVRGVPKRAAGEDFYLLNKLAKVGKVISLSKPVLAIQGRPSLRVPFGTGPALVAIGELTDPEQDYLFYHPEIFVCLRALLSCVNEAATVPSQAELDRALLCKLEAEQQQAVSMVLNQLHFERLIEHLAHQPTMRFSREFHSWFDAFVTLKFVHLMRDLAYPSVGLKTLRAMEPAVIEPLWDRLRKT